MRAGSKNWPMMMTQIERPYITRQSIQVPPEPHTELVHWEEFNIPKSTRLESGAYYRKKTMIEQMILYLIFHCCHSFFIVRVLVLSIERHGGVLTSSMNIWCLVPCFFLSRGLFP